MEKIICFTVVKPQGIKGELKVKILADGFESVKSLKTLYDANGKSYSVLKIRDAFGGFAFITLKEVVTRNDAELFRNVDFFVEKSKINKAENEFFIADIIGLDVVVDGAIEGKVLDVITSNVDMFEVAGTSGKKWYFPFLKSLDITFDFSAKKLFVSKEKLDGVKYSED
ncbi:MAG: 16S rRNA processing protein RimM [Clostridia bacterium]|nr:16S rRNA processing protein RimM [Clostridia bacterium]